MKTADSQSEPSTALLTPEQLRDRVEDFITACCERNPANKAKVQQILRDEDRKTRRATKKAA